MVDSKTSNDSRETNPQMVYEYTMNVCEYTK